MLAGMLLILVACAPRPPIRGAGEADAATVTNVAKLARESEEFKNVQGNSVEPHGDYTLAFVEFDGRGRPAREGQIESAAEAIRDVPDRGKSVVVLFVHGWGHSADALDEHVKGFRDVLSRLAGTLKDRRVIGIYVGWPARWLDDPLHYLTFWDRSRAAQKISRDNESEVVDVLRDFQRIVKEQRSAEQDVVSIAVGHSLGGKFLFTPIEECLERDTVPCKETLPPPEDLSPFGDIVILVNPAQDIHDFEAFTDYEREGDLPENTPPVVAIFSSDADGVVGRTFKAGRTLRNIVTPWNWDDFHAESTGLGKDPQQITHTLCFAGAGAPPSRSCDPGFREEPPKEVVPFGQVELRRYSSRQGPFIVTGVHGSLIEDHSDIFNETFLDFLVALVRRSVGRISSTAQ
jgi:hypothetical protein